MDAVDEADPVAARAHHERVRARAVGEVANSSQQIAVRDAGRRDDRLARRELLGLEDVTVFYALLARLLDLAPRRRPQLRLQLAAETTKRGRRQHGLPSAADADREMVVRSADRCGDRCGH